MLENRVWFFHLQRILYDRAETQSSKRIASCSLHNRLMVSISASFPHMWEINTCLQSGFSISFFSELMTLIMWSLLDLTYDALWNIQNQYYVAHFNDQILGINLRFAQDHRGLLGHSGCYSSDSERLLSDLQDTSRRLCLEDQKVIHPLKALSGPIKWLLNSHNKWGWFQRYFRWPTWLHLFAAAPVFDKCEFQRRSPKAQS
jgi:hypothetical protein